MSADRERGGKQGRGGLGRHHVGESAVKSQRCVVVVVAILALTQIGDGNEQFLKCLPFREMQWWSGLVAPGADALEAGTIPAMIKRRVAGYFWIGASVGARCN